MARTRRSLRGRVRRNAAPASTGRGAKRIGRRPATAMWTRRGRYWLQTAGSQLFRPRVAPYRGSISGLPASSCARECASESAERGEIKMASCGACARLLSGGSRHEQDFFRCAAAAACLPAMESIARARTLPARARRRASLPCCSRRASERMSVILHGALLSDDGVIVQGAGRLADDWALRERTIAAATRDVETYANGV